jgi:hypothetical protein
VKPGVSIAWRAPKLLLQAFGAVLAQAPASLRAVSSSLQFFVSGFSDPLESKVKGWRPFFDRGRFSASFVRLQGGELDRAQKGEPCRPRCYHPRGPGKDKPKVDTIRLRMRRLKRTRSGFRALQADGRQPSMPNEMSLERLPFKPLGSPARFRLRAAFRRRLESAFRPTITRYATVPVFCKCFSEHFFRDAVSALRA